jgi:mRNA-degrading endonuclease toxin of MazEF toxin-antitoxin module
MLSTTTYEPGDVVTVRFQFREDERPKPRPAVIVSVPEYHDSRIDAIMVAVSARTDREFFGDCPIDDWQQAGLLKASKAKGIIRTVQRSTIRDKLGSLSEPDKRRLKGSLRSILGL